MRSARLAAAAGAAAMAALAGGPAAAHHSRAMFDMGRTVSISGTVKEVQWTNPHIWVEVMVPDDRGQLQQWSLEGSAPVLLTRRGWRANSLKPGDKVTIDVHPLRSGQPGGSLGKVVRVDGAVVGQTAQD